MNKPAAPKGNPLLKGGLSAVLGALGAVGGTAIAPGVGTAVGGALGSGIGTALGRALGNEAVLDDGGWQEIGIDTVLGGAFSGAGKAAKAGMSVAGKQIGKEVVEGAAKSAGISGVRGAAERAGRAGVIARNSTIGDFAAQSDAADFARRYLPAGSAKKKFQNIQPVISQLTDQADEVLKGVKQTTPFASVRREFVSWGDGLVGPEKKQFDNLLQGMLKPYAGKQELTALELNQMRRYINNKFPNMFKKLNTGGQLTGTETAANEIRSMLGSKIDDLGGDIVRPINRDIAVGLRLQPELKRTSEQVSKIQLPFTNTPIPGAEQLRQSVSDRIGRAAAGTTNPLTLTGALTRQGVREGLTGGIGQEQPVAQDQQDVMMGDVTDTGFMPQTDMTGMEYDPSAELRSSIQMAMLQDLQETGGKRVPALKSVLETLTPPKQSAAATKAEIQTSTVVNRLGQLEELFTAAGGGRGRIGGLAGSAAGAIGMDEGAYNYNQFRDSLLAPLARAISGEVGVLTDKDIKRADGLLPKLTDSPKEANQRIRNLLRAVQEQQVTNQRVYAGGGGQSSLSDVMYNMEGLQ